MSSLNLCSFTPLNSEMKKKVITIWKSLYDHNDSFEFRNPVDWKGMGLTDYLKYVQKPMDLNTVNRKLRQQKYRTVENILDDLMLIFDNCKAYNSPGSWIYKLAEKLEKCLIKMIRNFIPKIVESNIKSKINPNPINDDQKDVNLGAQENGQATMYDENFIIEEVCYNEKIKLCDKLSHINSNNLESVIKEITQKCPKAIKAIIEDPINNIQQNPENQKNESMQEQQAGDKKALLASLNQSDLRDDGESENIGSERQKQSSSRAIDGQNLHISIMNSERLEHMRKQLEVWSQNMKNQKAELLLNIHEQSMIEAQKMEEEQECIEASNRHLITNTAENPENHETHNHLNPENKTEKKQQSNSHDQQNSAPKQNTQQEGIKNSLAAMDIEGSTYTKEGKDIAADIQKHAPQDPVVSHSNHQVQQNLPISEEEGAKVKKDLLREQKKNARLQLKKKVLKQRQYKERVIHLSQEPLKLEEMKEGDKAQICIDDLDADSFNHLMSLLEGMVEEKDKIMKKIKLD